MAELIANLSILFPVPGYLITLIAGTKLNPFLVALLAGLGASIGELTGYLLGIGGRKLLTKKLELGRIKKLYGKYGLWTVYIFAAFPLPFDIVGMICGVLKINLITFFLLTFAGKFTSRMFIAYSGKEVYELIVSILSGEFKIDILSIALIAIFFILALISFTYWRLVFKKKD
ncbi:MAG: VTT domain-containing protein [Candidatus Bathyarchaeia archaeon]